MSSLPVIARMWQHDETGRLGFVDEWQLENGFEANNPRLKVVSALADHAQATALISQLQGELEAAKKDAERYRHMRGTASFQDRNGPGLYWYLPRTDYGLPIGERLDAAIDAALSSRGDAGRQE